VSRYAATHSFKTLGFESAPLIPTREEPNTFLPTPLSPQCIPDIITSMEKITLNISGMHCGSCAVGIQMLTSQMDGVKSAEVGYDDKKGTFEFDPAKTSKAKIIEAIEELGYKVP